MRTKHTPNFLSPAKCISKVFFFHPNFQSNTEIYSSGTSKARRQKIITNEQKEILNLYPYNILLLPTPAPPERLLQTISLPITEPLSAALSSSDKHHLYFNNNSLLFLFHDEDVTEFIIPDSNFIVPLLFAASSILLESHYRVSPTFLYFDVCVKESYFLNTEEFPRPIPLQQYEKLHDFLVLQLIEDFKPSIFNKHFIYSRHSETQSEFTLLLKCLFDVAQHFHDAKHTVWKTEALPQHQYLTTSLRPYQVDAVKWMCYRESSSIVCKTDELLNQMFIKIPFANKTEDLFFSIFSGTFTRKLPTIEPPCRGGILADEMGLGKTLEIISLVLTHPSPYWNESGGQLLDLDDKPVQKECFQSKFDHSLFSNSSTSAQNVLCSCGGVPETAQFEVVRCSLCKGPAQHAICVQYEPSLFLHRLPIQEDYVCPQCWTKIRIDSKATLIVSPDHIWQQWKEELQMHVSQGALDVLVYAGMEAPVTSVELGSRDLIKEHGSANPFSPRTHVTAKVDQGVGDGYEEVLLPGFVQPPLLASADIVLTSYSVVQRELDWAEVVEERQAGRGNRPKLRLAQRYLCRPSPLTSVRWWRICLDEAQMVERVGSKTARMLSKINAVHRWCVTGTPAEKSIDDLYGLFAYLRFMPYSLPHYWHSLLYQPFLASCCKSWNENINNNNSNNNNLNTSSLTGKEITNESIRSIVSNTQLSKMLNQILWRNTKMLVGDQLKLPPVSEQFHWISFTPVEKYIHDRVLAQSAGALDRMLQTMSISPDRPLASLPGAAHWRLVYLITRLRQACTHASLVVATSATQKCSHKGTNHGGRRNRITDSNLGSDDIDFTFNDGEQDNEPELSNPTRKSFRDLSVSDARAHRHLGTGCFTMTEVIRRVVDETRRECEGLLRQWVFNKNGAAGCFIIKQNFIEAADCYRDVLRYTEIFEHNHGVLADWSQRLHAITNLHWLLQSGQVAISNESTPLSATKYTLKDKNSVLSTNVEPDEQYRSTDPRVDWDLPAKAERLRTTYVKMHSHLLDRVHQHLDPIVMELDNELNNSIEQGSNENLTEQVAAIDAGGWLSWLAEVIDLLISCGMGNSLIDMLVASFQSRPSMNRSGFRTTLLYAGSAISFKAMLLTELAEVFSTREKMRLAMQPLDATWESFKDGREVNRAILQPFYACCSRSFDMDEEDKKNDKNKKKKKFKLNDNSNSQSSSPSKINKNDDNSKSKSNSTSSSLRRNVKKTRCAYCIAVRALCDYQSALNHERVKSTITSRSSLLNYDSIDFNNELDNSHNNLFTVEESGNGIIMSNPLVIALSIVCQQFCKLIASTTTNNSNNNNNGKILNDFKNYKSNYNLKAKRLEQLIRLMGKEILLTSRTQSLTKEWWNIHDDMEQFVVRLQATCPTDLAFIHLEEVDAQLQSYIVEANLFWPQLQSRLGHFNFLRNAHLTAVTRQSNNSEKNTETTPNGTTANPPNKVPPLECPTCLQYHSPEKPTFVLLPGCWHTLCVSCHDRIASLGQVAQRRCPICRTPFKSHEAAGINARRRRPLTLIHYSDNESNSNNINKLEEDYDNDIEFNIIGDHSSKVRAVIRCLKSIKNEDPDAKAIVFSSWLSVLVTMAGALEQNGLGYATLFHARDACRPGRLAGFQCSGSTTWILLMPVQLGANGLNLTSANHVIFVDPVLSHGREAQAIARMHRIGQIRPGIVHRFLVRDSIEAALHASHVRNIELGCLTTDTECMIGAGTRRTSSTALGVAGPSEDREQLMQMTIGQLSDLLHFECNIGVLAQEMKIPTSFD